MRKLLILVVCFSIPSFLFSGDSYLDSLYSQGMQAWRVGDYRTAMNFFYRYKELADKLRTEHNQSPMVGHFYLKSKQKLKPAVTVVETDENEEFEDWDESGPLMVPRKKSVSRAATTSVPATQSKRGVGSLLAKADFEKSAGRFENARRLYGLAQQVDPGSEIVKARLAELSRQMDGN